MKDREEILKALLESMAKINPIYANMLVPQGVDKLLKDIEEFENATKQESDYEADNEW